MIPNSFNYFQELKQLKDKYYYNTVNKFLFPFRYREHYDLPLGDWAQNPIGSVYTRLYPIKESQ